MRSLVVGPVVAVAGVLLVCAPAGAQTTPARSAGSGQTEVPQPRERRPYRGLFAGNEAQAQREGLQLRLSASGGYDDNVIAGQPGSDGPENPVASGYGSGDASLSYWIAGDRASFGATGTTQLRVYENDAAGRALSHSGAISSTLPIARRWTLNANQTIRYSPYYHFDVLPGLPPRGSGDDVALAAPSGFAVDAPNVDRSLTTLATYGYGTALDLTHDISDASVLQYSGGFRFTDFPSGSGDSRGATAGVHFARRMTRYANLRLGYVYQEAQSGFVARRRTVMHHLDLGGGYSRPLSFSRRTTVSFSGGTALVDAASGQRYQFLGDASVHREIGRTWLARFAFRQGVQFVEVLPDPLYGASLRASVDGLLGRRADLSFDAGYSTGAMTSSGVGAEYRTASASARFRFAVSRALAWYSEYAYSQYVFGEAVPLPQGFSNALTRHSIRTGISVWIPLFTPRQSDAAR
jgi:hypothetical protein